MKKIIINTINILLILSCVGEHASFILDYQTVSRVDMKLFEERYEKAGSYFANSYYTTVLDYPIEITDDTLIPGYHAQMYYPQDCNSSDVYDMVKYDFESIREIDIRNYDESRDYDQYNYWKDTLPFYRNIQNEGVVDA